LIFLENSHIAIDLQACQVGACTRYSSIEYRIACAIFLSSRRFKKNFPACRMKKPKTVYKVNETITLDNNLTTGNNQLKVL
jgi:hypothetical protein